MYAIKLHKLAVESRQIAEDLGLDSYDGQRWFAVITLFSPFVEPFI